MSVFYKIKWTFLLADLVFFLLCFPAVYYIIEKADLPLTVYSSDDSILIKHVKSGISGISKNDRIISVDNISISKREDIEIILDSKKIGSLINLTLESNGSVREAYINAVSFYSSIFVIFQTFTVLVFLALGIFVFLKCPGSKAAEMFHLGAVGTAFIMNSTWGFYSSSFDITHISRFIFHAAYMLSPVIFVHFSLAFPVDNVRLYKKYLRPLYVTALLLTLYVNYNFYNAAVNMNAITVSAYSSSYNFARYFIAFNVFLSIVIFFTGYFRSKNPVEKKKLKWVITGFVAGPLAFIFLWVIPQALTDYAFIPEYVLYLLMLSVPVTFTISIFKYHLLNIDLIISRSIIYSIAIAGVFAIYFAVVIGVSFIVTEANPTITSGISAVFIALLFNPLRTSITKFVDRKFFRVQYDFREAVKNIFTEMKEANDTYSLANKAVTGISRLIPAEKIALIDISETTAPKPMALLNFPESDLDFIKTKVLHFRVNIVNLFNPDKVESGIKAGEKEPLLKEVKINLLIPSDHANMEWQIALLMGNKKSGNRYSAEDLDLLQNIVNTASSFFSKLKLQEDLIRKILETEQLAELNKQKSLFVSSVSHDLKTPLTSIKLYSELIRMNSSAEKINSFADFIEGESERLTTLINNVLNFSRIEKGIKEYHKEYADINEVLRKSISIMNYQLNLQGFNVECMIEERERVIFADADALTEAFINFISNAMKYSGERKIITISSYKEGEDFFILFRDYGIGISKEDQKSLFIPFYRSGIVESMKIPGTGLGLSIIKHIADAHNIVIQIESEVSSGTTFKLLIPKTIQEEIYEEHSVN